MRRDDEAQAVLDNPSVPTELPEDHLPVQKADKDLSALDYLAFISYRHADNTEKDQKWASWLHSQLEAYKIPLELIGTTNSRGEIIAERLYPVFRDEVLLSANADLSASIAAALNKSRILSAPGETRRWPPGWPTTTRSK